MSKILVVDDSRSMRKMILITLEQAGHEVVEAEDGEQGLAAASQHKFDAIISDINMPKMTGLEMVERIRLDSINQKTPIVCLTTESTPDIKEKGKRAGATGWMVKPFTPDKLNSVIQRVAG